MQGLLHLKRVTLVNVYGPNIENPQFFEKQFFTLSDLQTEVYIGGDFNLILDPIFDWSSHRTSATFINEEFQGMGLGDIWRKSNKNTQREDTLFIFSCPQ